MVKQKLFLKKNLENALKENEEESRGMVIISYQRYKDLIQKSRKTKGGTE